MLKLKKILVPVDFSEESKLAVEWAVKLGKEENESIVYLFHALPLFPMADFGADVGRIVESEWNNAKDQLQKWGRKIPPPLSSEVILVQGNAVEGIKSACERNDIDLVVMTTHGRHGLKRIIDPNISEQVARTATCPVLVLHLNSKMKAVTAN
jgi:nucleotide-binding universal stress UspA family protein